CDSLTTPYLWIDAIVLVVAFIFSLSRLPEIQEENSEHISVKAPLSELLQHKAFVSGVVAQFLYVAAQTGINSFFINYTTEALSGLQQAVAGIMQHLGTFG